MIFPAIAWNDPAVQAAVIGALGTLTASAVAGICATVVSIQLSSRRRILELLATAQDDVLVLLQIEKAHCELHQQTGGASFKNRVRQMVADDGYALSGRFTPSRIRTRKLSPDRNIFSFARRFIQYGRDKAKD